MTDDLAAVLCELQAEIEEMDRAMQALSGLPDGGREWQAAVERTRRAFVTLRLNRNQTN